MSAEPVALIEICADCVQYLANGEVHEWRGSDYVDVTAEHGAKVGKLWDGYDLTLGGGPADEEDADGFISPWFSWRACESCGSHLGGDREYATAWRVAS